MMFWSLDELVHSSAIVKVKLGASKRLVILPILFLLLFLPLILQLVLLTLPLSVFLQFLVCIVLALLLDIFFFLIFFVLVGVYWRAKTVLTGLFRVFVVLRWLRTAFRNG